MKNATKETSWPQRGEFGSELRKALTQEGKWASIMDYVRKNRDKYDVQVRANYLNIYYNGGNILRINPRFLSVDEFYFHMDIDADNRNTRKTIIQENAKKGAKKAKEIITKRITYIKSIMRIEPKAVKITNSRGRWGACNSNKNISLNWRIIMLTPACIDYVIVHELCHLVEMNHSKRFWTLVETFLPNYNDIRAQMKEYGFLLDMYR